LGIFYDEEKCWPFFWWRLAERPKGSILQDVLDPNKINGVGSIVGLLVHVL
jgi:hypothetical protein